MYTRYNRAYLRLKACPRCKGDILIDKAVEEAEVCIQCGFRKYFEVTQPPPSQYHLDKTFTELYKRDISKVTGKA